MGAVAVEDFKRFYLEEYEPGSGVIEETDVIPDVLLKGAAEAGSYRLTIPAEFGGWGLGVIDYLPYLEVGRNGSRFGADAGPPDERCVAAAGPVR